MPKEESVVIGGVDTHKALHAAAVLDELGRVLGNSMFSTTASGYADLLAWMRSFGKLSRVGVEGSGAYGAGLSRHLGAEGVEVIEVDRPDRQARRRKGKSDPLDAVAAARAVVNGEATNPVKEHSGIVESIRAIRVAFTSARESRTRVANQIRDLVITAPDELRAMLGPLKTPERVARCARFRPGDLASPLEGTKIALRALARRYQVLSAEMAELEAHLGVLSARANPALRGAKGVGVDVATILLTAAGDNPKRLRSESAFAKLSGAAPLEASSGQFIRHRLNRGGNRQANHALWRIVMVRLTCDPDTKAYVTRRTTEGKSQREIVRCLKRYVAREIYRHLTAPAVVPNGADLRAARQAAGISLTAVAEQLDTWPTRVSEVERGLRHDTEFASRYEAWLVNATDRCTLAAA